MVIVIIHVEQLIKCVQVDKIIKVLHLGRLVVKSQFLQLQKKKKSYASWSSLYTQVWRNKLPFHCQQQVEATA